jgi:hypothetical protein
MIDPLSMSSAVIRCTELSLCLANHDLTREKYRYTNQLAICQANSMVARKAVSIALLLLLPFFSQPAESGTQDQSRWRNTSQAVQYVGSEVCGTCHADIARTYSQTDMGRSLRRASPAGLPELNGTVTVHSDRLNRYFQVSRRQGSLYQSEYESSIDGSEVFRHEQQIHYAIGSGQNGIGFLIWRDGFLFEAPLSYYTRSKNWDLSPGFEAADFGFNRPVLAGCITCHSGRSEPLDPGVGAYRDPPFQELGIGCENCHGPGELHVNERKRLVPLRGNVDTAIVNPSKLPPWLADNICMNCHQGRALRILQPGKHYQDFRPGTPLNDTVALFATLLRDSNKSHSVPPLLEHHTLLSLSKCYTATNGRLSCITCHDPHVQASSTSSDYFRQKCLQCHSVSSCRLPVSERRLHNPADNCTQCHMAREPLNGIAHSVLTDHRITRTPDQPFPTTLFNSRPADAGLLHLNAIPGGDSEIPPLTRLRAWAELASSDQTFLQKYRDSLSMAGQSDPKAPEVLSGLAWLELAKGTSGESQAVALLTAAVAAGTNRSADYEALSHLLIKQGNNDRASAILKKGISVFPYEKRLFNALFILDISDHRYEEALETIRRALGLFPEDPVMRTLAHKAEQAGTLPNR